MRTKEKFYDNLSNFHVSKEKKIERMEFRDVKTLDAMTAEAKKIKADGMKALATEKKFSDEWEVAQTEHELIDANYDQQKEKMQQIQKENEKRYNDAGKDMKKLFDDLNKATDERDAANKKADEAYNEYQKVLSRADNHQTTMKSAIDSFEASAKALGVDVGGKISKYKAAMKALDDIVV